MPGLPFRRSRFRIGKSYAEQMPGDDHFVDTRLISFAIVVPEDPVADSNIKQLRTKRGPIIIRVKSCYIDMVNGRLE